MEAWLLLLPWKPSRSPGNFPHPISTSCLERAWPALLVCPSLQAAGTLTNLLPLGGSHPWGTAGTSRLCVCSHATLNSLLTRPLPCPSRRLCRQKSIPLFPFYDLLRYQKLHSLGSFQESSCPTALGRGRRRALRVKGTVWLPGLLGTSMCPFFLRVLTSLISTGVVLGGGSEGRWPRSLTEL